MQGLAETARPSAAALLSEELALHRRLCERDESALVEYLDRVGHVIYCTALLLAEDTATAEDMTERVFIELWRRPEDFSPKRGPVALQLLALLTTGRPNGHVDRRGTPDAIPARGHRPSGRIVYGRENSNGTPADSP